jgi:alkyldihydroxyacetonephosphate synthase
LLGSLKLGMSSTSGPSAIANGNLRVVIGRAGMGSIARSTFPAGAAWWFWGGDDDEQRIAIPRSVSEVRSTESMGTKRWNGWGSDDHVTVLDEAARAFLAERVGPTQPLQSAPLDQVLAAIPASRLGNSTLFKTDARERLMHARGQSLPDWLALRHGRIGPVADGVALPQTHEEAVAALNEAQKIGATVIPYGGGTSVVGHLTVPGGDRPVVNISLERMNQLLDLDETSMLARIGAGTPGPQVEAQLKQHGWLLGHFPQSYEYSTVGGWVVTRSSGQQSLRYGRIEQMFAAGKLATPRGEWLVGGHPASSAGPDMREVVLGSEGRIGLLTEATMRVRRLPEREDFHGVFFPSWEAGFEAARRLVQADLPLSMVRVSNPIETDTQLRIAGHAEMIAWMRRYLRLRGLGAMPSMMVFGTTGSARDVVRMRRDALAIARQCGGINIGRPMGKTWNAKRYFGPYLRNTLWDLGYAADTVETAINWPQATGMMQAIEEAARNALSSENERVHAFTHLSHVYRQGCSIYSTFIYRASADYETNFARWQKLKRTVSETIVQHGGTISHQHGVGADHAPYLPAEKGALGIDLLRSVAQTFDPQGLMNPGKLFI